MPDTNEEIIILPVRNLVLFPGTVLPIAIGRSRSIAAAQEAVKTQKRIGILLQRDIADAEPAPEQLYRVGTVAGTARYVTAQDGAHHLIAQDEQRFTVDEFLQTDPYLRARVTLHTEEGRHRPGNRSARTRAKRAGVSGSDDESRRPH